MNCSLFETEDTYVFCSSKMNKDLVVDLEDCIDLGPILFVLASFNEGSIKFINTKRLTIKESNRAEVMKQELNKVGVNIQINDNEIIVKGKNIHKGNYEFDSPKDHRIAMAMMVYAAANDGNSLVKGAECVSKSYPKFISDLFSLKIDEKNS